MAVAMVLLLAAAVASAGEPQERGFEEVVRPFLKGHCLSCHGAKKREGKLDLSVYASSAMVTRDRRAWDVVLRRLEAEEMPPDDAPRQPSPEARKTIIAWIRADREREARENAGDPGPVPARRLSNAEYDYTIRDLTGVDIRPTKEFPVDPANEAGFDNTAESLTMSPALVKKYLEAARGVTDHVVLKPDGLAFAPHQVVTDTNRDEYCVRRILDFYDRHRVDYADYFLAAWRSRHRPGAPLREVAAEAGLSAAYLETVAAALREPAPEASPLGDLQALWEGLPDNPHLTDDARRGCERMRDLVVRSRKEFEPKPSRLQVRGISPGSQWLVLARNREAAAGRMTYPGGGVALDRKAFEIEIARPERGVTIRFRAVGGGGCHAIVWKSPRIQSKGGKVSEGRSLRTVLEKHAPAEAAKLSFGKHPHGQTIDGDSFVLQAPADIAVTIPAAALPDNPDDVPIFTAEAAIDREHSDGGGVRVECGIGRRDVPPGPQVVLRAGDPAIPRYEAAFATFCRVFPQAFFVSDRGAYFDAKSAGKGRPLTAGFHLMQGYFRDDAPLYQLLLDDAGRRELDGLWRELDFVTGVPLRQYHDFIFFERAEPPRFAGGAEFDFARSEDKDATAQSKIRQMAEAYLAKARKNGANGEAVAAIETYFAEISTAIRRVEQDRRNAEPSHLEALARLAARAYRRPLSPLEREGLAAFYRRLRDQEGLGHEDAIRDSVVRVLMSPNFCFRVDPEEPGESVRPLADHALASRLSYFLWSSMPDDELMAHAEAGDLHEPAVLAAQAKRMLRDGRVRGLATEFAGNWLDFRRFEEHNGVDRGRFPAFTNDLRRAMYEEPIRFFVDVASRDGSVLDLLDAGHTFVNPVLARHYGMPVPEGGADAWTRVDDARRYGRGGLLAMSVFLTKNAPGLRTSPVKRGYWVVRRVLGEEIPPPPPTVPELPKDESATGELTLPQLLARHRAEKSCAACHDRFDSIGLAFEGYGPVGERRDRDLGGRPVDARATFPDGHEGAGIDGLRRYLDGHRRGDFVDNLCRKLLAYGLGRTLLPSDEATIIAMKSRLATDGFRFHNLVETIVTSPQFLNHRGRDDPRGAVSRVASSGDAKDIRSGDRP
jgi:mono/diheme cytochrome c family protein